VKLLISNVDGTLLGDDGALHRFADWIASHRDQLRLIYNSGRTYDSICRSIHETALPDPDAIISSVGTDVRLYPSSERLDTWQRRFRGWNGGTIQSLLDQRQELVLQPPDQQTPWKVSFYARSLSDQYRNDLKAYLTGLGFRVNVIYSSNRDLDVVPAEADKGTASSFLAQHWNIPPGDVFVCGDSGNDLSMFRCRFRGIVVANAHPELKSLINGQIYHASSMFADGVIEGMEHWLGQE